MRNWLPRLLGLLLCGPLATAARSLPPDTAATRPARRPPALLVAIPRFVVELAASNRNAYLNRAPARADDRGYLASTLTYQTRWGLFGGLYLNHSFGFTNELIDDTETTLGFARSRGATEWSAQYTHLFVSSTSGLLKGSITDNLAGSLSHDFDLVQASLTADLFVGGAQRDVALTADLGHSFYLPAFGTDTLSISPTVEVGLGTQNFYAQELTRPVKRRTGTFKRSGKTGSPALDAPAAPGFGLTGYTFSVPLELNNGRTAFTLTPAYLLPVRVPEWGSAERFFYLTVGFTRRFW